MVEEPTQAEKREAAECLRSLANPTPEQADALPKVAAWLDQDPRREEVRRTVEEIFVYCGAAFDLSVVDAYTSSVLDAVDVADAKRST